MRKFLVAASCIGLLAAAPAALAQGAGNAENGVKKPDGLTPPSSAPTTGTAMKNGATPTPKNAGNNYGEGGSKKPDGLTPNAGSTTK